MARELNLFIDTDRGVCVSGFTSTIPATLPNFKFGDTVPVTVRALTPDAINPPYKEYDLTDKTIRLGIGVPAGVPSSGTWLLTYGANTTAALAFGISATDLQTALNALASITSAGGVTVTKGDGLNYRIVFNTAGSRTDFSSDTALLYPSTGAFVGVAMQGSVSAKEVVLIALETQPAAYVELTDELPVANIGVTVVRAGASGIGEIQTIDLSTPEPYGGSYSLAIDGNATPAITYNATAEELQTAIEAASEDYVDLVTVTGAFPLYTVSFDATLTAIGAAVPDESALVVPTGRTGSLNCNTAGMIELLNGASTINAKLEIEIFDTNDSTSYTPVQQDITVIQDVIPNSPASSTPLPVYLSDSNGALVDASNITPSLWRKKLSVAEVFLPENYGALADGETDDTEAIQAAIDAAEATGGVVQLQSKPYRVEGNIYVHPFVVLQGNQASPRLRESVYLGGGGQAPLAPTLGTVLNITGGAGGSASDTAAITLEQSSGIQNLAVYYPDQDRDEETPTSYPFAIRCLYYGTSAINIELINPYRGIDVQGGRATISEITGNPLAIGIRVDKSYDTSRITDCHFVLAWTYGYAIDDWFRANSIAFQLMGNDSLFLSGLFTYGYSIGVDLIAGTARPGTYGILANSGFDGCKIGVRDAATSNDTAGFKISNVDFTPLGSDLEDSHGYRALSGKVGTTLIDDGRFWGGMNYPMRISGGTVRVSGCKFFSSGISAIYVDGSTALDLFNNHIFTACTGSYDIDIVSNGCNGRVDANTLGNNFNTPLRMRNSSAAVTVSSQHEVNTRYARVTGGSTEYYKDTTPTKAWSTGPLISGQPVSDDYIIGRWNGSNWAEVARFRNSDSAAIITLPTSSAGLAAGTLWNNAGTPAIA